MRVFEILDKMNISDTEKATATLGVCKEVISVNRKGHNGEITIGVPGVVIDDVVIHNKDVRFILLIVDGKEYDKIKNEAKIFKA